MFLPANFNANSTLDIGISHEAKLRLRVIRERIRSSSDLDFGFEQDGVCPRNTRRISEPYHPRTLLGPFVLNSRHLRLLDSLQLDLSRLLCWLGLTVRGAGRLTKTASRLL